MEYNRREFLKTSGATIACTCLGSLCVQGCTSPFSSTSDTPTATTWSYRIEAEQIVLDLEKTPELRAPGDSVKLEFKHSDMRRSAKILIVHPEDTSYLAFSNFCTHRGKEIEYHHPDKRLACVSGHSTFDLKGRVVEGKADDPLSTCQVGRVKNLLFVTIIPT